MSIRVPGNFVQRRARSGRLLSSISRAEAAKMDAEVAAIAEREGAQLNDALIAIDADPPTDESTDERARKSSIATP